MKRLVMLAAALALAWTPAGAQTLTKLKAGMVTGIDQIGLPIALYVLRALAAAEPAALALAAIVVAASVLGLTKAETERIWLFLMPLACLAAATTLPLHRLRVVLTVLAIQALATEVLFTTVW